MTPTSHAQQRMAQRAIPADFIEILSCFGIERAAGRGVERLSLARREAEHLRRRLKHLLQRWDHLVDAYAVVTDTNTLITTAHDTKRGPSRRTARSLYPLSRQGVLS
ncbi:hypothetical protein [Dyella thiooxydans]|uniref:hypothetical protein n=1 Tax=Dyella thiooxydans TaxID=445710 RepID=UPI0007C5CAEC|nr:hypothetical protein [Dyella thiooxydans]